MSAYQPPAEPSAGRMCTYHHVEDGRDWPALILDVDDEGGVTSCHLQVFRARANFWGWAVEGPNPGQWSWPMPKPTESSSRPSSRDELIYDPNE